MPHFSIACSVFLNCKLQQACTLTQVNAEATVELAYSLSEHGLTPAAFRAFAVAMERIQDTQQVILSSSLSHLSMEGSVHSLCRTLRYGAD